MIDDIVDIAIRSFEISLIISPFLYVTVFYLLYRQYKKRGD